MLILLQLKLEKLEISQREGESLFEGGNCLILWPEGEQLFRGKGLLGAFIQENTKYKKLSPFL